MCLWRSQSEGLLATSAPLRVYMVNTILECKFAIKVCPGFPSLPLASSLDRSRRSFVPHLGNNTARAVSGSDLALAL